MASNKPNPFALFAYEYQDRHRCKSTREAFEKAGPIWKQMSAADRQPYMDQAKKLKNNVEKYTSDGVNVAEIIKRNELKEKAKEREREEVKHMIQFARGRGPSALANLNFFIIHCNVFCYNQPADIYVPAEIAILKFNLRDGVQDKNVFHFIVNPGPMPVGYKFESQQHSDATHKIEIPLDYENNDNQEQIYFDMKAFIEKHQQDTQKVLFADTKNIIIVQNIINTWNYNFDDEQVLFKVYAIENMFYNLRNSVRDSLVWPSITAAHVEIEKDIYSHAPNTTCKYHSQTDGQYCSRSIVIRRAFIICDHCCVDLNIKLVPGCHVPINAAVQSVNGSIDERKEKRSIDLAKKLQATFDSDEENSSYTDNESIVSSTVGVSTKKKQYRYDSDETGSVSESTTSTVPLPANKAVKGRGFAPPNDTVSLQPGSSRISDEFPPLGATKKGRGRGIPSRFKV